MKVSDYPNISKEFKKVYKHYLACGGVPQTGLATVDIFLNKYPYYAEALIFKARMLIALAKYKEALSYLKAAQKVDTWKFIASFDEAEILCHWGNHEKAVQVLSKNIELIIKDALDGIDNFLVSFLRTDVSEDKVEIASKLLRKHISNLALKESTPAIIDELTKLITKNKGARKRSHRTIMRKTH